MAIECHCLPRISELPVDKSWGKVLSSYKPYLPIIYAVRWPSANISNAWQAVIIYILFIDMTVMERGQRWTNTENINWVQNMYSQILLDDSELFYTIQNHMIWVKIWSNITNPIPKWMTLSSRTEQQEGIFFFCEDHKKNWKFPQSPRKSSIFNFKSSTHCAFSKLTVYTDMMEELQKALT